MSDQANAPEAVQTPDDSPLSRSQFMANVAKAREEQNTSPATPQDGAAEQNSGQEPETATAQEQPSGDDTGSDDTEEALPLIDPPASWTKDEKKAWESLPRDLQESLAERERARRADIDRRLNEVANESKAIKAKEEAAEQARKHFESQLPVLQQAIQSQFNAEFSDIKSWDDVQKMAGEDPLRYNRWQAMREHNREVAEQVRVAQQRQEAETANKAKAFFEEENRKFLEKAPEFADAGKASELRKKAFEVMQDVGFEADEINDAWANGWSIPVHDHRFQLMVRDLIRLRSAEKAVKNPAPKPAPQVQRPGPAAAKSGQKLEAIKALEQALARSGSREAYMQLQRARRRG